jgi:hypothetical protein
MKAVPAIFDLACAFKKPPAGRRRHHNLRDTKRLIPGKRIWYAEGVDNSLAQRLGYTEIEEFGPR